MRDMLLAHLDQNSKNESETSSVSAINTATSEFISAWENATNADEQNAAIEKFTADYSKQAAQLMGNFITRSQVSKSHLADIRYIRIPLPVLLWAQCLAQQRFSSAHSG